MARARYEGLRRANGRRGESETDRESDESEGARLDEGRNAGIAGDPARGEDRRDGERA